MELEKSLVTVGNDEIQIGLPIQKIDKERRTVSGFATLDNVDSHGDVITAEASTKAFSRWRGNIREMHMAKAVGKLLSLRQEDFYDEETQKIYRGVFVDVYVSKGAEDTWEKVLDGTLTGFSVGGRIKEKEPYYDTDLQKNLRKITDYEIIELSLVDNPANKLANILSLQKVDGELMFKGMVADTNVENVLYCPTDRVVAFREESEGTCMKCDEGMKNIGWVESTEGKEAEVEKMIKSYYQSNATTTSNSTSTNVSITPWIVKEDFDDLTTRIWKNLNEGGAVVATEKEEEKVEKAEEVAEVEETEEEEVAKAEEVSEVPAELDSEALLQKFSDKVLESLEGVKQNTDEAVEKARDDFKGKFEELEKRLGEFEKSLEDKDKELKTVTKKVDELGAEGAIKKSADPAGDEEEEDESFWRGSFLGADALN